VKSQVIKWGPDRKHIQVGLYPPVYSNATGFGEIPGIRSVSERKIAGSYLRT